MNLQVLGIDLGKTVFHLVGLDSTGKVVIRKKCSRRQLLVFTANLQVELIGMESCSSCLSQERTFFLPLLSPRLRKPRPEKRLDRISF